MCTHALNLLILPAIKNRHVSELDRRFQSIFLNIEFSRYRHDFVVCHTYLAGNEQIEMCPRNPFVNRHTFVNVSVLLFATISNYP